MTYLDLIRDADRKLDKGHITLGRYEEMIEPLNQEIQPTVQPERKKGYWIPVTNGRGGHECDRCHDYAPSYQSGNEYLANFCPNCGARMKGDTSEAD